MNFKETLEFQKDFKRLFKKYKTLPDDLIVFQKVLNQQPKCAGKNFSILTKESGVEIIKARFFCRSLKRNSLRIIYAYHKKSGDVEFVGIEFIELYFKGNKEREDEERIKQYLKKIPKK